MTTAIWWVRRDLRLSDNQALAAAAAAADEVLPVFVLDPVLLNSPYVGTKRLAFLFDGLQQLDGVLRKCGGRLVVRRGRPRDVLAALVAESGAGVLFAERDYSPYARQRDGEVAGRLPLTLLDGVTVQPPGTVVKADGAPYVVFTPFSRAWLALHLGGASTVVRAPLRIHTPDHICCEPIPVVTASGARREFPAGEAEAQSRLAEFAGTAGHRHPNDADARPLPVYRYSETRNRVDLAGTSCLSPYLRFGMLSARQVVAAAFRAMDEAPDDPSRQSAATWLNELIWREFYFAILAYFPEVRDRAFRAEWHNIPWLNEADAFDRWRAGRTGYPIVDAAMRQLAAGGWMHNRARMIAASFLVKDLLIDWRWGERWFMQQLVDGDPASNNGGWQWTAGTGTDAAPYFRIFNPVTQGATHDPDGAYIRRWVPELARVPGEYIHQPWRMPVQIQRSSGCVVGREYPEPMVNHRAARERTLKIFAAARSAHQAG